MTVSDETLMAYADGEADAATIASVETAMREDPEIAKRVAQHRAMRETMHGAFAETLREPVPERLIAAARGKSATVVDIAGAREAAKRRTDAGATRRWQPAALAASLLLGVGVGFIVWHGSGPLIAASSGGLTAGASLAEALSSQLSDDRSESRVAVTGLSFRDKTGAYCRTFSLSAQGTSGLACRDGAHWRIKALAQSATQENVSNFRMAGSAMPAPIRAAVEDAIDGEPLDRPAEMAARDGGWKAAAR